MRLFHKIKSYSITLDFPSQLHEQFGDQLHWFLPKGIDRWVLDNVPGVADKNVHGMVWWDEVVHPDNGAKVGEGICIV